MLDESLRGEHCARLTGRVEVEVDGAVRCEGPNAASASSTCGPSRHRLERRLRRLGSEFSAMLAVGAIACSTESGPRHPMPSSELAVATTSGAATRCFEGRSYDPREGCVSEAWGIPLRVVHDNRMTRSFRLIGAAFALDGTLMLDTNDPAILARPTFSVAKTSVARGKHEIEVLLVYAGNGDGVFAYLKKYRFRAQNSLSFEAGNEDVVARVVGFERGGATTPLEKRPALRLEIGER